MTGCNAVSDGGNTGCNAVSDGGKCWWLAVIQSVMEGSVDDWLYCSLLQMGSSDETNTVCYRGGTVCYGGGTVCYGGRTVCCGERSLLLEEEQSVTEGKVMMNLKYDVCYLLSVTGTPLSLWGSVTAWIPFWAEGCERGCSHQYLCVLHGGEMDHVVPLFVTPPCLIVTIVINGAAVCMFCYLWEASKSCSFCTFLLWVYIFNVVCVSVVTAQ